jgi:SOS-response transcriptional repressor LexA
MSDEDARLQRLRAAMARELPPVPFVGAGFSSAVTGNACATWNGLLRSGIDECVRQVQGLPSSWVEGMEVLLRDADAANYLTVAEGISDRLRPVRKNREFDSWLKNTVGKLEPAPEHEELIVALCGLGDIIFTTNYDTLIERSQTAWTSCTWNDTDYAAADLRKNVVIHLHGVVDKPRSIIFGKTDYERLEAELYQSLDRAFFARRDFVFIGCGAGLADPHIGPLLDFIDKVMLKDSREYFILIKQDELAQYDQPELLQKITPVPYQDLLQVLRDIAPPEKAETTQDPPSSGEQRARDGLGTGLLNEAKRAEQKLLEALGVLGRVGEAMREVQRRRARTREEEMGDWSFEQREDEHEQYAAAMLAPVKDLEARSKEALGVVKVAGECVWQLANPRFAGDVSWLPRIRQEATDLNAAADELLTRAEAARSDLRGRVRHYDCYQNSFDALRGAHEAIEETRDIAASLRGGLDELLAAHDPGAKRPAAPTASQAESDASSAPPRYVAEAMEARRVSVEGDVAAGAPNAGPTGDGESVWIPSQITSSRGVYAVRVNGDSMIKDDMLDGDYAIVDSRREFRDGEIAVVTTGGEGHIETSLKRVWREQDGLRLVPSNPNYKTTRVDWDQNPDVDAVIGVFRRARPRPPTA